MDPEDFIRLSIGSLGLRIPTVASKSVKTSKHPYLSSHCSCEIRLRGFPIQTAPVPLIISPESNPDPHTSPIVFYLEKSNVKALVAAKCFQTRQPFLEIAVYIRQKKGAGCSVTGRKKVGMFRVDVAPEWSEGKPSMIHNGWIRIGERKVGLELHLKVKLDLDPRYVFMFEDETALSPQIVQLQGSIRQRIFSCKFSRDRRASQLDLIGTYWSNSNEQDEDINKQRERKGWKVTIHDLSGSAAAAALMVTPFVPANGCDRVARSNPGAWLIVRPHPVGLPGSWHPWGRLEAWRETAAHDSVCLRFFLLPPEGHEGGVLVSEVCISAEKGGEFFIDMDKQMPVGTPVWSPEGVIVDGVRVAEMGGFVMNCRVEGEGKSSKPMVHLAMRHVSCIEDAAIFMALAAAVDLSIEACRPFWRKAKKGNRQSLLS